MSKHRIKHHHWKDGFLDTQIEEFETLEEALAVAADASAHFIKIYDDEGCVVHTNILSEIYVGQYA
jgi:hypothetical protein